MFLQNPTKGMVCFRLLDSGVEQLWHGIQSRPTTTMNDLVDIVYDLTLNPHSSAGEINEKIHFFIGIDHKATPEQNFWTLMGEYDWHDTRKLLTIKAADILREGCESESTSMRSRSYAILMCILGSIDKVIYDELCNA